jgi:hypothetical protein
LVLKPEKNQPLFPPSEILMGKVCSQLSEIETCFSAVSEHTKMSATNTDPKASSSSFSCKKVRVERKTVEAVEAVNMMVVLLSNSS